MIPDNCSFSPVFHHFCIMPLTFHQKPDSTVSKRFHCNSCYHLQADQILRLAACQTITRDKRHNDWQPWLTDWMMYSLIVFLVIHDLQVANCATRNENSKNNQINRLILNNKKIMKIATCYLNWCFLMFHDVSIKHSFPLKNQFFCCTIFLIESEWRNKNG